MTIYIASKSRHAARWRQLRAVGAPIISTWIDEDGPGESDLTDLWRRCILEASQAKVTIVYVEEDETQKGALVEMGAALACDRTVFWVGPPGSSSQMLSATNHTNVTCFDTLEEALARAMKIPGISFRGG